MGKQGKKLKALIALAVFVIAITWLVEQSLMMGLAVGSLALMYAVNDTFGWAREN